LTEVDDEPLNIATNNNNKKSTPLIGVVDGRLWMNDKST
jgi:hypothetical protein